MQKGVGDIMRGALIETEARRLRDQAKEEAAKEAAIKTALRLFNIGKLTIEEVAIGSGLTVDEVKDLANMQPV